MSNVAVIQGIYDAFATGDIVWRLADDGVESFQQYADTLQAVRALG